MAVGALGMGGAIAYGASHAALRAMKKAGFGNQVMNAGKKNLKTAFNSYVYSNAVPNLASQLGGQAVGVTAGLMKAKYNKNKNENT